MNIIKNTAQLQYHQELGGLEMVNAKYHRKNFSKHAHEGYTISVIETGTQRFYRSGGEHLAPQDSIIFVNANDVHTGQAATESGWSYRAIYPLESQFQQLANDLGVSDNFAPYFKQAVVFDPQMAAELRQLFTVLAQCDNRLLRETMLNGVLTRVMFKHGRNKPKVKQLKPCEQALQLVRQYIHDHLADNISLDYLAKLTSLSPFYLVRQFQQRFGLPPHAYQIQRRLQKSKTLLKQGCLVINVALELGFHDQSHFHRHFKRAMGVSPTSYSKAIYCG